MTLIQNITIVLQLCYRSGNMLEYLSYVFGKEHINKQRIEISGLPIYMNSYEYELYTIFNKSFIFMKNKNEFNINSYLKHRIIIEEKYNFDTVLVLNNSKEVQRLNLINNKIMFIEKINIFLCQL